MKWTEACLVLAEHPRFSLGVRGCQGPIGLTCFFREVLRKTGR